MPPFDIKSPAYDGTVCLSRKIFLEEWLLPKLATLNSQTTWVTTHAEWTDSVFGKRDYRLEGHTGITEADVTANANFGNVDWVYDTESQPGTLRFKYSRGTRLDDETFPWHVYMRGATDNSITIPEGLKDGKGVIEIKGQTLVHSYLHINGAGEWGIQQSWVTCTWATNIILDGVDEGHLKIRFEPSTITPEIKVEKDTSWLHPARLETITENVKTTLSNLDMGNIVAELATLFSGNWGFVFAGAGDFFIDKACFNREGDLMCQVSYKGV